MAKDRQSSWASGELTKDLQGQSGTVVYRTGAGLLRNFLVTPQATAWNRSGSVHLATLGAQTSRLVPFIFGGDPVRLAQIYAKGQVAMRTADGDFAVAGADDTTLDTVTPSRAAVLEILRNVRTAQAAGTLMVARPDKLVDVRRADSTHYVTLDAGIAPPEFGSSVNPFTFPGLPAAQYIRPAVMRSATGFTTHAMAGDGTHPARPWDYIVTRVVSITSGDPEKPNQILETMPWAPGLWFIGADGRRPLARVTYTVDSAGVYTAANVPLEIAVYGDWTQRIDVSGQMNDLWAEGNALGAGARSGTILAHRVYRGRDGVYGYLGETTTRFFVDDGRDPDIANPPPMGVSFGGPCVAVEFANDRRLCANLGASGSVPARVLGSAVGNWADFDPVVTPDASDSLSFDLAANKNQEIRHLLATVVLLAFTDKKTWAIVGSGNLEVLTPTAIAARPVLSVGSANYPAPVEGDSGVDGQSIAVFFIEAKGGRPYVVTVDGNGAPQLTDLSLFSSHYFEGHTIVDMAWARDPHLTLWAVRDDGVLLSLTFAPGAGVRAWALHQITGGTVEAVATLPILREDLLYMVVNRGGTLHLERLATRIVSDPRYECHLDCASIEDGTKAFTMTVTGVSGGGASPYVLAITIGSSGGLSVAEEIMFPDANGYPVRATVTAAAGTSATATVIDYSGDVLNVTAGTVIASGQWGIPAATVAVEGLPDGTVVSAYVDGNVTTNLVVGADITGQVTLPIPGLVRTVGLPFTSQLQSLAIDQERGKQKIVSRMHIELGRSRGGAVGTSFDSLTEIPPRKVSDGYGVIAPREESVNIPVTSSIETDAIVVLEQSQPRSIKVLAIEREYVLGG